MDEWPGVHRATREAIRGRRPTAAGRPAWRAGEGAALDSHPMLTGPRDDAGLVGDATRDDPERNERFLPSPVDAGQKRLPIDMDYVQRLMM